MDATPDPNSESVPHYDQILAQEKMELELADTTGGSTCKGTKSEAKKAEKAIVKAEAEAVAAQQHMAMN